MKRVVRWIGAVILAAAVMTMVLADIVLAEPVEVRLLDRGPTYGLVADPATGDMTPQVVGEAGPILLVPGSGEGRAAKDAAVTVMNAFCAARGYETSPPEAWADEFIHFDPATGYYHFPHPCGMGL